MTFALCTWDFSKVFDLVKVFGERGIKYILLAPGERIDRRIDAAIVEGAGPIFTSGKPPIMRPMKDPNMTADRAVAMALGVYRPGRLAFGIDPGLRIGLAVLADGTIVNSSITTDPEVIPAMFKASIKALKPRSSVIRLGDGDPSNRDRILKALHRFVDLIEIVDERDTSVETVNTHRDSAVRIARIRGRPLLSMRSGSNKAKSIINKQGTIP